jgi:spore maturation protein CgeB
MKEKRGICMTVLYMDWPGYGSEYIKKTFEKMGFKVVVFDFPQNSNGINLGTELNGYVDSYEFFTK